MDTSTPSGNATYAVSKPPFREIGSPSSTNTLRALSRLDCASAKYRSARRLRLTTCATSNFSTRNVRRIASRLVSLKKSSQYSRSSSKPTIFNMSGSISVAWHETWWACARSRWASRIANSRAARVTPSQSASPISSRRRPVRPRKWAPTAAASRAARTPWRAALREGSRAPRPPTPLPLARRAPRAARDGPAADAASQ